MEKVRDILKIAQEPVSLETPIGEEEDSHLGDFIPDEDASEPAEAASFTFLHEQLEQHIVSECLRELRRTQEVEPEPCLALFEARREQLRALRSAYGEPGVTAWLKGLMCTALVQSMGALSSRAAPAVCRCISGALVDACVDWVLDPNGLEREAFLRIVTAFLTGGIQSQTAMT